MEKLEGLIAAPFTPMHDDGSIRTDVIARVAATLDGDGVRGAFVCGTTGEGLSLASEERMAVAEAWVREAPAGMKVIVHVGHASVREAQKLAEHAAGIGAHAVAVMPASPLGSRAVDDVAAYVRAVARAVPDVPVFYYHIPSVSGFPVSVADLLAHLADVPNLAGAKFTHEDLFDFGRSMRLHEGRFDMLFGRDEMLLAGMAQGARAAVGSTYNFAAPLFERVIQAYAERDVEAAAHYQAEAQDLIALIMDFPSLAAQKYVMGHIGPALGPVRAPMRGLTEDDRRRLEEALERADFIRRVRQPAPYTPRI